MFGLLMDLGIFVFLLERNFLKKSLWEDLVRGGQKHIEKDCHKGPWNPRKDRAVTINLSIRIFAP